MTEREKPAAWRAEARTTVMFNDLDPMQVVWHGNYPKYLELARFQLLEAIGYNYEAMQASGYAWPIIDMHIRYPQPATLGQQLKITAEIVEWEYRLRMRYAIYDEPSGRRITTAETVQIAVDLATGDMCFASPDILLEKLGVKRP